MSQVRESGPEANAQLAIVIIAADKGTQLKSRRPKVLHEVGGKPLLGHVLAAASQVVPSANILVVGGVHSDRIRGSVSATGVRFVEQAQAGGIAGLINAAMEAVPGCTNILVLSGDTPLIRPETIVRLWQSHQQQSASLTILQPAPTHTDQRGADSGEAGIYAFRTAPLLTQLNKSSVNGSDLSALANLLRSAGEPVATLEATDASELRSASTIAEIVSLDAIMRVRTTHRLMESGVTIYRPETCVIDVDVEIAPDTVIEPFVQLLGQTKVGSDCLIRSYSVIENCTLGDGVLLRQSCILTDSTVAAGAKIGPFSHLRPGSEIGEDAHVGNFVETKKARLGKGAKANHLTYLGDAEIGDATNIGAGVITCNYDGVHKHKTQIGKGSFIGSDSTLVAPLAVGDGAYIGAGSCVTKDVPSGALAVGRARQVTKEGWAVARRARQTSSDKK